MRRKRPKGRKRSIEGIVLTTSEQGKNGLKDVGNDSDLAWMDTKERRKNRYPGILLIELLLIGLGDFPQDSHAHPASCLACSDVHSLCPGGYLVSFCMLYYLLLHPRSRNGTDTQRCQGRS